MKKSLYFSIACFLLGILLFWQSLSIKALWQEPMGPGVFPKALSILLIIASAASIVQDVLENRRKDDAPERSGVQSGMKTDWKQFKFKPNATVCLAGISFLYVLGLTYLGFYVSTVLFVLACVGVLSFFSDKNSWKKMLLRLGLPLAVCIIAVLIVFENYLHIYIPSGGFLW